jgi:hypothetical protein
MADLAKMVADIIVKTEAGKLQWEEPDLNELEASLPPYSLHLRPSREGLTLTLFNSDGRPIDSVNVSGGRVGLLEYAASPNLLKLFELAKRNARRVDESLVEVENLLRAL